VDDFTQIPAKRQRAAREKERRIEAILGPEIYALTVGESPFDEFDEEGFVVARPATSSVLPEQMREDFRLLDEHAEQILADLGDYLQERENQAQRGFKALMLAKTVEVCRALLARERVPWNVLNYVQLRRYGLKRTPADGRLDLDDVNDVRAP
jgi:hypothetical protein